MELKVVEILKGDKTLKSLNVLGDNGILCREYITRFPIGSEWVFAIQHPWNFPTPENSVFTEDKMSWEISNCGVHWLQVSGTSAEGYLWSRRKRNSVSIVKLRSLVNRPLTSGSNGRPQAGAAELNR